MESGPRALGHRSILADPRAVAMKDRVNREIKMRESFRPFAPAVLEDEVHQWFDVPAGHNLPFMLEVVRCRPEKLELVSAVCHVDGTARVQTVSKASDPLFFELLQRFKCLTGVPLCLNTSFNVKGEPIVCSPSDALRCFFSTGLDSLIIGSFLVVK